MYLQWYLELLRLYCRFDSYRERSILSGNERKIIAAFFMLFFDFDDKFVSGKCLKKHFINTASKEYNMIVE